jgi:hypothetical protein
MQGPAYRMPLTLRSSGPIAPQTCSGAFALRGPSEDYDVNPETPLSWRLVIPAVEWEILGVQQNGASAPDANMGSLGKAGERKDATLHVRYTGKPPFSLQLSDLNASTEHSGVTAEKDDLDLVTASPVQKAGAADEYEVPIELLVRRSLPQASPLARWLSGTDYSGKLKILVAGLPASQSQEVSFASWPRFLFGRQGRRCRRLKRQSGPQRRRQRQGSFGGPTARRHRMRLVQVDPPAQLSRPAPGGGDIVSPASVRPKLEGRERPSTSTGRPCQPLFPATSRPGARPTTPK